MWLPFLDLEDLLQKRPIGKPSPAEVARHEAMHATWAHVRAIIILWISILESQEANGHLVVELGHAALYGRRGVARLMHERLDAIDFYVAGPLGGAALRTRRSGYAPSVEAFFWHLADTGGGQEDLHAALAIARKLTDSRADAIRLVIERIGLTAHRIVARPQLQDCAHVLAALLLEFEELDGCDVHWALDRALDGFSAEELAPRLERRLRRAPSNSTTGLHARHAWLAS